MASDIIKINIGYGSFDRRELTKERAKRASGCWTSYFKSDS